MIRMLFLLRMLSIELDIRVLNNPLSRLISLRQYSLSKTSDLNPKFSVLQQSILKTY